MAPSAPRVPEFAKFLREETEKRTLQQVVIAMKGVGVKRVRSAILHYQNNARVPPVHALRGFAAAYRIPFEELVDRILAELGVAPVEWGKPIVHRESELPEDALALARAYASSQDEHLRSAARLMFKIGETSQGGQKPQTQPRSAVGERRHIGTKSRRHN